jgi:hypothetical protein
MQDDDDDNKEESSGASADSTQAPPEDLQAMESLAEGYKYYVKYLKKGGRSGITGEFGIISIGEDTAKLIDDDEKEDETQK